jgi:hypothetical protein
MSEVCFLDADTDVRPRRGVAAAVKHLDGNGVSSTPVYSAYRGFVTRTLASTVCKGERESSQETRARRRLRADYNLLVAGKTIREPLRSRMTRLLSLRPGGRSLTRPRRISRHLGAGKSPTRHAAFAQGPPTSRHRIQAAHDALDDSFYRWRHWEPPGKVGRGIELAGREPPIDPAPTIASSLPPGRYPSDNRKKVAVPPKGETPLRWEALTTKAEKGSV